MGRTFLAAPLLLAGECKEMKLTGNDEFNIHDSEIGRAMDAFTHHVWAETGGNMIPADLQGMVLIA